jgi:hypothetical protein
VLLPTLGIVLVALMALGVWLVRSGYLSEARQRLADQGQPAEVVDLHSVKELQAAFNDDTGAARLVLLLSPT